MIDSADTLRRLYPHASPRSRAKQLDRLDDTMRRFVAHAPLCVIASAGAAGEGLDSSPRGGRPGFVTFCECGAETVLSVRCLTRLVPATPWATAGRHRLDA